VTRTVVALQEWQPEVHARSGWQGSSQPCRCGGQQAGAQHRNSAIAPDSTSHACSAHQAVAQLQLQALPEAHQLWCCISRRASPSGPLTPAGPVVRERDGGKS
jgi:hypothetical protein